MYMDVKIEALYSGDMSGAAAVSQHSDWALGSDGGLIISDTNIGHLTFTLIDIIIESAGLMDAWM